jgi:hypothetical protein
VNSCDRAAIFVGNDRKELDLAALQIQTFKRQREIGIAFKRKRQPGRFVKSVAHPDWKLFALALGSLQRSNHASRVCGSVTIGIVELAAISSVRCVASGISGIYK